MPRSSPNNFSGNGQWQDFFQFANAQQVAETNLRQSNFDDSFRAAVANVDPASINPAN